MMQAPEPGPDASRITRLRARLRTPEAQVAALQNGTANGMILVFLFLFAYFFRMRNGFFFLFLLPSGPKILWVDLSTLSGYHTKGR